MTDDVQQQVEELNASPVEGVFRIVYAGGEGAGVERVIEQCRRAWQGDHEVIHAFCRLRGALRTFRVDQIELVVDDATGEILPSIGNPLPPPERHTREPRDEPDDERRAVWAPELDVLTFVASLSSSMRDSQVGVIAQYLEAQLGAGREWARIVKRHRVPGPEDFRQAFKHVPHGRGDALMAAAEAVLQKVGRDGELDRGVLAMAQARRAFIGKYDD